MEPYGLQVYLYLAGNRDGFTLELSQEAAEREAGIKKTSFHKYVNLMIEKGYLVQRGEGSNIYDFYERPQEQKKKTYRQITTMTGISKSTLIRAKKET